MNLEIIIYLLILISILYLCFFIYFKSFSWSYRTDKTLKKAIKKAQRKGIVCNGQIRLPPSENLKKLGIERKIRSTVENIFHRTFHRVIVCENDKSVQLIMIEYNFILETKIKIIHDKLNYSIN